MYPFCKTLCKNAGEQLQMLYSKSFTFTTAVAESSATAFFFINDIKMYISIYMHLFYKKKVSCGTWMCNLKRIK